MAEVNLAFTVLIIIFLTCCSRLQVQTTGATISAKVDNNNLSICSDAVWCNLIRGDLSRLATYNKSYYAAATSLAASMKSLSKKQNLAEVECQAFKEECSIELNAYISKKMNFTGPMNHCGWSSYPYMIFRCSTITLWPSTAVDVLKPSQRTCNLLPSCDAAIEDFEGRFKKEKLPEDWNKRKREFRNKMDAAEGRQSPPSKYQWSVTKEDLANQAATGLNVEQWDNSRNFLTPSPWLLCDPGTYMTKYWFKRFPLHRFCCLEEPPTYIDVKDFGMECTTVDVGDSSEANVHGLPHPLSNSPDIVVVENENFFLGFDFLLEKKAIPRRPQARHMRYTILSHGPRQFGNRWAIVSYPLIVPVVPGELAGFGLKTSYEATEFRQRDMGVIGNYFNPISAAIYPPLYYNPPPLIINEQVTVNCTRGKFVCGVQPQTDFKTRMYSLRILCCGPEVRCNASESYRFVTFRTTSDDKEGHRFTVTRTEGYTRAEGSSEGGSKSFTHMYSESFGVEYGWTKELKTSFQLTATQSFTSGTDWSKSIDNTNSSTATFTDLYFNSPGFNTTYWELVAHCGELDVHSNRPYLQVPLPFPSNCVARVEWSFRQIYKPNEQKDLILPVGTNFSHPERRHVIGPPFVPLEMITDGFNLQFRGLGPFMKSERHTLGSLLIKFEKPDEVVPINPRDFPHPGFLYQLVGHCEDNAKFHTKLSIYTEVLKVIKVSPPGGCVVREEFREAVGGGSIKRATNNPSPNPIIDRIQERRHGLSIPGLNTENLPPPPESTIEGLLTELQDKFTSIGTSPVTGYDWTLEHGSPFSFVKTIPFELDVTIPPESNVVYYELIGICGDYEFIIPKLYYEIRRGKTCISSFGFTSECSRENIQNQQVDLGPTCEPSDTFLRKHVPPTSPTSLSFSVDVGTEYAPGKAPPNNKEFPNSNYKMLANSFQQLGISSSTRFDWRHVTEQNFPRHPIHTETRSFEIPAGDIGSVYQLIADCDDFHVLMPEVYVRTETIANPVKCTGGTGPFKDCSFRPKFVS